MTTGGSTEPSADLRELASVMWQTYVALIREGFTEPQALAIIGHILSSAGGQS